MDNIENFKSVMADHGLDPGDIIADGKIHRFATWGDRGTETAGAYWMNGTFGWFQDFRTMANKITVNPANGSLAAVPYDELSASQKAAGPSRSEGQMLEEFRRIWGAAETPNGHKYLEAKGIDISLDNVKEYDGRLLVPVFDVKGNLQGLQRIAGDGSKKFLAGTRKAGHFFAIPGDDIHVITEGFSTAVSIYKGTGHTVIVAFDAGNLEPVAKVFKEKVPAAKIIIAADNDSWREAENKNNIGVEAAKAAATSIGCRMAVPVFQNPDGKKTTDFNDLLLTEGPEVVKSQIAAAALDEITVIQREASKLLDLDAISLSKEKDRIKEEYGVPKSVIDIYLTELKARREVKQIVEKLEPAEYEVDGLKLANRIRADISRRVVLPDGALAAIVLWSMMTYTTDAFGVLAILGITSPEKRCGKTKLLEVLSAYVNKPLVASNISPAALYRTVESYKPSLLVDEADSFLEDNNELRGVLNSGHSRAAAFVLRTQGEGFEPVKFNTFCPKAIALIGALPSTLEDRSILIRMDRKIASEKIIRTGFDFASKQVETRRELTRWAADNINRLKAIKPKFKTSGNDRADDNWLPLLTVAGVLGGDWPKRAMESMALLADSEDSGLGILLLQDIYTVFDQSGFDRLSSTDLADELNKLTESPWGSRNRGDGLNANGLAWLLTPFKVNSKNIRFMTGVLKGYTLKSFKKVFSRYIPFFAATTLQVNDINDLDEKQSATFDPDVAVHFRPNCPESLDCSVVAAENPVEGEEEKKETEIYDGMEFSEDDR